MLRVDLDEHGLYTVDHHGAHDRGVQLPTVAQILRLGKGEIMTGGQYLRFVKTSDTHDADGDIDGAMPVIVLVKYQIVYVGFVIAVDLKFDIFFGSLVKGVFPVLGNGQRLYGLGLLLFGRFKGYGIRLVVLRQTGVRIGEGGAGIGGQFAVLVDVILNITQLVPGTRIVLDVRNVVQGGLGGIDGECDGIDHAVQQSAGGRKIPVDRVGSRIEMSLCRSFIVKGVGLCPFILEVALAALGNDLAVHGDGVVRGPGDRLSVRAHGIGDLITGNEIDPLELVVAVDGHLQPVLVGRFVYLNEVDDPGGGFHVLGGAVAHRHGGNAQSFDDLPEDIFDSSVQGFRVIGVVVVVSGGNSSAVHAGTVGTGIGVIDQIVQQVGLSAVGIDAEQGCIGTGLDGSGLITSGVIEGLEIGPGTIARRVDGVVAVAGRSAGAVGDQDDEGGVRVGRVQIGLSLLQSGFPVGAVVSSVIVGIGDRAVHTVVKEAVDAVVTTGKVGGPRLSPSSGGAESYQSNLDVAAVTGLVAPQILDEVVHDVFGIVRAVTVRVGGNVVAGHTGRFVVYDQHVHVRRGLDLRIGVAFDGKLDLVGTVCLRSNGLLVIRHVALISQSRGREGQAQGQHQQQAGQEFDLLLHSSSPFSKKFFIRNLKKLLTKVI